MKTKNLALLAMASGDLYIKLLRTILADRRVPDRGIPARSRLLRLQNESRLLSEYEVQEITRLLTTEVDPNNQKTRIDGIHQGLVDCNASPVAIAISSIARSITNSENELLNTATQLSGEWRLSPESQGDPVVDHVGAAIAGACLGAAIPGGDASTAVLASVIGAAFAGAFFQE